MQVYMTLESFFKEEMLKGRMNAKSTDEKYTELIGNLRQKLNLLAYKIAPKSLRIRVFKILII
jgi:hypothetical protein